MDNDRLKILESLLHAVEQPRPTLSGTTSNNTLPAVEVPKSSDVAFMIPKIPELIHSQPLYPEVAIQPQLLPPRDVRHYQLISPFVLS